MLRYADHDLAEQQHCVDPDDDGPLGTAAGSEHKQKHRSTQAGEAQTGRRHL